jgi:hypothetical protein
MRYLVYYTLRTNIHYGIRSGLIYFESNISAQHLPPSFDLPPFHKTAHDPHHHSLHPPRGRCFRNPCGCYNCFKIYNLLLDFQNHVPILMPHFHHIQNSYGFHTQSLNILAW